MSLKDLYYHFRDSNEVSADEAKGMRKRKKTIQKTGRKRKLTVRHPWQRILNITFLNLPHSVLTHVLTHGTSARDFLAEQRPLVNNMSDYDGQTVGDAFMACYRYTIDLEARMSSDKIKWCFSMLMFFDLSRLIRPNGAGNGRWGNLMVEEVAAFLGPVLGPDTVTANDAKKQINRWSTYGRKLDLFCQTFTPGSLFFLAEHLSADL